MTRSRFRRTCVPRGSGFVWIPKIGWVTPSRRGGNPYAGCKPVQAVVKRVLGKWYGTLCYAVPETAVPHNGITVGVDRNCGQAKVSDGRVFEMPDLSRLEARTATPMASGTSHHRTTRARENQEPVSR